MVVELAAELVAGPLDRDVLAALVPIALVVAVVAEHVTCASARPALGGGAGVPSSPR